MYSPISQSSGSDTPVQLQVFYIVCSSSILNKHTHNFPHEHGVALVWGAATTCFTISKKHSLHVTLRANVAAYIFGKHANFLRERYDRMNNSRFLTQTSDLGIKFPDVQMYQIDPLCSGHVIPLHPEIERQIWSSLIGLSILHRKFTALNFQS